MKKGWKIALISLGSLVGMVAIVVAVACWLLFTPARLTAIVNRLAGDYLTCENHFEKVDFTLFKTYPNVGLEVKDVVLINPYQMPADDVLAGKASHNDTLAQLGSLTLGVDLKAFLSNRSIIVRQLRIDDAQANLYTAPDGWSNLNIFKSSESVSEETPSAESESAAMSVELDKIVVSNLSLQYCNLQSSMLAKANGVDVRIKGAWDDPKLKAALRLSSNNLFVDMLDSAGNENIVANLQNVGLGLEANGSKSVLDGKLDLETKDGTFALGGTEYTTAQMRSARGGLLELKVPFHANLDQMLFHLAEGTRLRLSDYCLDVWGDVNLPKDDKPMNVDVQYTVNRWNVGDLLAILPPFITQSLKGMDVAAKVDVEGTAKGVVADGRLPIIGAKVRVHNGSFSSSSMLPYPVKDINATLWADVNLCTDSAFSDVSKVRIDNFSAKMRKTDVTITGNVDDLMGDMLIDANIKGNLNLPDLRPFLSNSMPLEMKGRTAADLNVKGRLSHITDLALDKLRASGTLNFSKLDVQYDSIHASSPQLRVALSLPTKKTSKKVSELIGAHITGGKLDVQMASTGLDAHLDNPNIQVGLPNILDEKQSLAAAFNIRCGRIEATMDSLLIDADTIKLRGSVRNDTTQDNVLKQWNPDVDIDLHRAIVSTQGMEEPVRLAGFVFNYKPEVCDIAKVDVQWGVSDYHLSGKLFGLEDWLSHAARLNGSLSFTSQYADIDQLMSILSGMGTPEDTIVQQRVEDNVPKEANPFIVPKDVNVKLNTHIGRCIAFGNDLNDLAGSVTVNDGVAVLDQIGFTCRAARMELTGVYKSPRVNHLFVGLDFHLLDIDIDELLHMVPSIDTLVPMLASFKGRANFHLAAETNLDAFYKPKMSTLIGAAAINGKDLVVMDNHAVANIAKLLQFKNWREKDNNIGIDSISVEAQVFRKEVIVYPFLLSLHNYQLCIGGRHTLTNDCNYHLELIKCPLPVRLAVDVNGKLQKPNIQLGKVQYAELYKPEKQNALQSRTLQLKNLVRQALEANVRKED